MTPRMVVVMGVSGVGKTTVGKALAAALGWDFTEGDLLHPPGNIAKMAAGVPLDDADREPWLDRVKAWIDAELLAGRSGILTCSALKRDYRDRLTAGHETVAFLYLEGDRAMIAQRLDERKGHFMPPSLLDSQFADLEPPAIDERAITIAADAPLEEQVRLAASWVRSPATGRRRGGVDGIRSDNQD